MLRAKTLFLAANVIIFSGIIFSGGAANPFPAIRAAEAASDTARWGKNELLPPLKEMTMAQGILARSVPLGKIDTDTGIEKLTGLPAGAGNAADFYGKLEEYYAADRVAPDKPAVKTDGAGVAAIFKAVAVRNCSLTPQYYPALTSAEIKQPDLVVFLAYARALIDRAKELEDRQNVKGADTVYRCALIFGWHLTQQPESLLVETLGLRIKALAANEYARFLQRQLDPREKFAREYFDLLMHAENLLERKLGYFLGNTLAFNSLYSAVRIATEDADPAWRREAILRLGVYRHGAPGSDGKIIFTDPAKQKDAEAALIYLGEKDPEATNRQLAVWVVNKLTPELFLHLTQQRVNQPQK
ncbi:hypothetical protein AGMMS49959_18270 [Planctomycetales bacterium]|nr:hypothetical protein AGMMS49959_18270 [Planctomycetales bacterium]